MYNVYIMLPTYHRDLIQGGALLPPRKLMRGEIMLQPPMMGGFMFDPMEMQRIQDKKQKDKQDRELSGEPEPEKKPPLQHSDFDTPFISDPRFQKVKGIPLKKLGEGMTSGLVTLGVPKPIAKKIGKESMHNIDMMSSGNTQDLFDAPVMKALDPVQSGLVKGQAKAMSGVSKTGKKIKKAFK